MKVIDLLNIIANDEEVPKKIKWEDIIYAYSEYDKDYLEYPFSDEEYKGLFDMRDSILTQYLNDEIEIIEDTPKEDKKIKRLGKCFFTEYDDIFSEWVSTYNGVIVDKLNEIIDKVNGE